MTMNRREAIGALAVGAASAWLGPEARAAQAQDDAEALYRRSIVIDTLAIENWDDAGFAAAAATGYTAIQTSLGNRNFEAARRDLEQWQKRFAENPDKLLFVTKAADIRRAKSEGKLGVMLGHQNATCVESDIRNVQRLYDLGTRCLQLTYNARNLLGDGCTERTNCGLSDFGVAVVERMNELGIIVDLSHCGSATSADGIEVSKKPPAFTHTMCKAIYDHPRAKSDELMRAMSDKGGMTGIVTLGYFVSPSPDATVDDYIRQVDHAVKVAGIDHVGLATDYQMRGIEASATRETWYVPRLRIFKPSYNVRWPPWIPELDKPGRFLVVTRALARRGYTAAQIEKLLGLNWMRYFTDVFGG
ncbi:MAG TPA: membrane dipeptidase [Candidatus Acidoferrales bacterium]